MLSGLYHKIKNANADELRRWRFVFWLSFSSFSLLTASILLIIGFGPRPQSLHSIASSTAIDIEHPTVGSAPLVGVMIDNALEARPQSGLNHAPLVIEAPVEGGYTRFMAFFASSVPIEQIGPVRSIRPYFLDLAQGFNASVAHIGGSPAAMDQLQTYPFGNIDGIKSGCCTWRSMDRFSPHNAYTSINLLKSHISNEAPPTFYYRAANDGVTGESGLGVEIEFTKNAAKPSWRYNPLWGVYIRSQGTEVLKEQLDNKPVVAENIAIMKTSIEVIDSEARRSVETTGIGAADFLLLGKLVHGSWERADKGMIVFKDAAGLPMRWRTGRLWIEVVDPDMSVTYF